MPSTGTQRPYLLLHTHSIFSLPLQLLWSLNIRPWKLRTLYNWDIIQEWRLQGPQHQNSLHPSPVRSVMICYDQLWFAAASTPSFSLFLVLHPASHCEVRACAVCRHRTRTRHASCLLPIHILSGYLNTEAQRSAGAIYHGRRPWQTLCIEENGQPDGR